jgi:site-specific recombinase XerD
MGEIIITGRDPVVEVVSPGIFDDEKLLDLFYRQKYQRTQSEHTLRGYQGDISRFMAAIKKPLATVTVSDLLKWGDTLNDMAPATRARKISAVRSLFRFAHRIGYLRFNPAEILERPKVPITSETRFLTKAELQALIKEARAPRRSPHLYPALVLMGTTAVRISELVGIRWCDFFQDVHGNIGLRVVKAKGGKPRTVKILPSVWQVVQEHRRRYGQNDQLDSQDTTPLFPGQKGKPITARNLQKSLKAAVRAAGIRKSASPHWLRHTAITLALVGGARVEQAQAMAGHSDLRTTTRYAHTAQQLQETAADYIRLEI